MSELHVYGKNQNIDRGTAGWKGARGLLDGSVVMANWVQALIMEGYGFGVGFGAADKEDTDPGTFGAGGVDLTEFDMLVTLPSNGSVGIIPIFWKPVFEAIGTIAAVDALLIYGTGGVAHASGIDPAFTNLRPDSSIASACTCDALADAAGTTIVVGGTIYREGGTHLTGVAGTGQTLFPEWSIAKAGYAPVIVGASRQVAGFASAQASTGFMVYHQLEMPDEFFS